MTTDGVELVLRLGERSDGTKAMDLELRGLLPQRWLAARVFMSADCGWNVPAEGLRRALDQLEFETERSLSAGVGADKCRDGSRRIAEMRILLGIQPRALAQNDVRFEDGRFFVVQETK